MTRANRREKWIAGLVVLIVGISVYVGTSLKKVGLEVPLLDGSTITVVPRVHLIGGLGPSAAYVVETSEGLVLIDTGLDEDAAALKSEMAKLGLDWKNVKAIFLTHVHGDHCGGAERIRAETGARIHAGFAEVPMLTAGKPREAFFSTFKMPGYVPHSTTVDDALHGGETISVGDISIEVLDTPGHTDGSMCYLMHRAGLRVLFAGDVIMRLGDMPLGTYSTYLAPRYRGDVKAYHRTLGKLKAMPVPDLVLPGHPSTNRGRQSPHLTRQQWEQMLDDGLREMERLLARYESDGAGFLDGNPKRLLPDLYYLGDFHGEAVYAFVSESQLFLVDAPGGPGLKDFLKERLEQLNVKPTEPSVILLTACGEKETAGLAELVDRTSARVIAGANGLEFIRKICPPHTDISSAADLEKNKNLALTVIPLGGPGFGTVAYLLSRSEKTVLISGCIPNFFEQTSQEEQRSPEQNSRQIAADAINSIRRLSRINPNLWLPAIPTDAQNANVYDGTWNRILEKSFRAANAALQD